MAYRSCEKTRQRKRRPPGRPGLSSGRRWFLCIFPERVRKGGGSDGRHSVWGMGIGNAAR